jgi:carbohydrate-binding DOMON domain-containing protein
MDLARPAFDPNFPVLKGPPYPVLSLDEIRESNPFAETLFDNDDSTGDDKGISGFYRYPTSPNFRAGILDITHANVRFDSSNVYFSLSFRNLTNPGWHPEYGFQLTMVAVAIHRGNRGTTQVGDNAQFVLNDAYRYDRLITIGGGVRVADEKENVLCEYLPRAGDDRNPIGNVARKSIEFSLPLKYLGKPTFEWKMTVLVGAQDDHGGAGVGEFRAVESSAAEWKGGGKVRQTDSNIYDILVLEH